MNYRIYLKTPNMKRFAAISGEQITHNLIHAEMWSSKEHAIQSFDSLISTNSKDFAWQLRDINQKIIKQYIPLRINQ